MHISGGVNELNVDPHLIACLLHAALEDMGDAELLRDLSQISRVAFKTLGRRAKSLLRSAILASRVNISS